MGERLEELALQEVLRDSLSGVDDGDLDRDQIRVGGSREGTKGDEDVTVRTELERVADEVEDDPPDATLLALELPPSLSLGNVDDDLHVRLAKQRRFRSTSGTGRWRRGVKAAELRLTEDGSRALPDPASFNRLFDELSQVDFGLLDRTVIWSTGDTASVAREFRKVCKEAGSRQRQHEPQQPAR